MIIISWGKKEGNPTGVHSKQDTAEIKIITSSPCHHIGYRGGEDAPVPTLAASHVWHALKHMDRTWHGPFSLCACIVNTRWNRQTPEWVVQYSPLTQFLLTIEVKKEKKTCSAAYNKQVAHCGFNCNQANELIRLFSGLKRTRKPKAELFMLTANNYKIHTLI